MHGSISSVAKVAIVLIHLQRQAVEAFNADQGFDPFEGLEIGRDLDIDSDGQLLDLHALSDIPTSLDPRSLVVYPFAIAFVYPAATVVGLVLCMELHDNSLQMVASSG